VNPIAWWAQASQPRTVRRSLKTSAVVGTVLVMINHGAALLAGDVNGVRLMQMLLTYLVPYCVSTYAAVSALTERDNQGAPRA
jgi:hypothetical protein